MNRRAHIPDEPVPTIVTLGLEPVSAERTHNKFFCVREKYLKPVYE